MDAPRNPRRIGVLVRGWCNHGVSITSETVSQFLAIIKKELQLSGQIKGVFYKKESLLERLEESLLQIVGADVYPTVEIVHIVPVPLLLPTRIGSKRPPKVDFERLLSDLQYSCTSPGTDKVWRYQYLPDPPLETPQAFIVNPKAKIFLNKIQEPFAVVSISGVARAGKSTFLTYLMRCLSKNPNFGSFECSDQVQSCTAGIWMWPELIPWTDPKTGRVRKILLLDLEGLGAIDEFSLERTSAHKDYFLQLFTFGCMVSSLMIFNSNSVLVSFTQDSWNEIGKLAAGLKKFSNGEDNERNWEFNRPHFLYVARRHGKYKTLQEDRKFWKEALANKMLADSIQMKQFFRVVFEASFLSLTEIPSTSNSDATQTITPEIELFMQKMALWADEEFGKMLQDFSVANITKQEGDVQEKRHLKTVKGGYFQIVEQFWKVVLSGGMASASLAPVFTRAIEGGISTGFELELATLKEEIRQRNCPFQWEEFNLEIEHKKTLMLKRLHKMCQAEDPPVPTSFICRADIDVKVKFYMEPKKRENELAIAAAVIRQFQPLKIRYFEELTSGQEFLDMARLNHLPEDFLWKSDLLIKLQTFHAKILQRLVTLKKKIISECLPTVPNSPKTVQSEEEWFYVLTTHPSIDEPFLTSISTEQEQTNFKTRVLLSKRELQTRITEAKIPNWLWLESPEVFTQRFFNKHKQCIEKRKRQIANIKFRTVAIELFDEQNIFLSEGFEVDVDDFSPLGFIKFLVNSVKLDRMDWIHYQNEINKMDRKPSPQDAESAEFKNQIIETLRVLVSKDCHIRIRIKKTASEATASRQDRIATFFRLHLDHEHLIKETDWNVGLRLLGSTDEFDSWICFLKHRRLVEKIFRRPLPPDANRWEFTRSEDWFVLVRHDTEEPPTYAELDNLCRVYLDGTFASEPKRYPGIPNHLLLGFERKPPNGDSCLGKSYLDYSFEPLLYLDLSQSDLEEMDQSVFQSDRINDDTYHCVCWPSLEALRLSASQTELLMSTGNVEPAPVAGEVTTHLPLNQALERFPHTVFKFPTWREVVSTNSGQEFFLKPGGFIEWNSEEFLEMYEQQYVDEQEGLQNQRVLRVLIATHTKHILFHRFYLWKKKSSSSTAKKVILPLEKPESKLVHLEQQNALLFPKDSSLFTQVDVKFSNTLDVVHAVVKQSPPDQPKPRILVLNFASGSIPGGTWGSGGTGQEEELFRRTDLARTLLLSHYPIPEWGAVLSPKVSIFRASEAEGYRLYDELIECDVISACPYDARRDPNLIQPATEKVGSSFFPQNVVRTFRKLLTIMQFASQQGCAPDSKYDHVILGDFGCENFDNPPHDIAEIWHEVLKQYGGLLKSHIIFAVNSKPNFEIFSKIIKPHYYALEILPPVYCHDLEILPLCLDGGRCVHKEEENRTTKNSIFHPPKCPNSDQKSGTQCENHCTNSSIVHVTSTPLSFRDHMHKMVGC